MGLWSILHQFLCGGAKDDSICQEEKRLLAVRAASLESEVESKAGEVTRLQRLCDEEVTKREEAQDDALRFYNRLQAAVQIPELAGLEDKVVVYPYDMTPSQWGPVRPIVISDVEYYTWTRDTWLKMLAPVQAEVKRVIGRAKPSIADCENWTLTMCDLVSLAFMRAGLDKQGAFLKLLSKPHSYCGFMLPDYTVLVYEPMNGEVIGKLGETGPGDYGEDTYLTEQAFFLA